MKTAVAAAGAMRKGRRPETWLLRFGSIWVICAGLGALAKLPWSDAARLSDYRYSAAQMTGSLLAVLGMCALGWLLARHRLPWAATPSPAAMVGQTCRLLLGLATRNSLLALAILPLALLHRSAAPGIWLVVALAPALWLAWRLRWLTGAVRAAGASGPKDASVDLDLGMPVARPAGWWRAMFILLEGLPLLAIASFPAIAGTAGAWLMLWPLSAALIIRPASISTIQGAFWIALWLTLLAQAARQHALGHPIGAGALGPGPHRNLDGGIHGA